MAKDAIYDGEREVRTFVDLNHGSNVLLNFAHDEPKGSYYTIMASLLLRAFTFEAYLNHLGARLLPFWESVDSIRVMEKFIVLCGHLGLKPEKGARPYQTLPKLFGFRNAIAHGKSVILRETKEVSSLSDPHDHTLKAEWEEYATLENADMAKADVSDIIKELHVAAGLGDYPFIRAPAIGSLSLKK
jgi:hypothetical protein